MCPHSIGMYPTFVPIGGEKASGLPELMLYAVKLLDTGARNQRVRCKGNECS